jgi:hypothetical protein
MLFLHTEHFTHGGFHTHKLSHYEAFTQKLFTQTFLHTHRHTHTHASTHRSFYTEKPSPKESLIHEAFTQSSFTHRRFFRKNQLLHTGAFAHTGPYTKKLLDADTLQPFKRKLLRRNFLHRETSTQKFLHKHTEAFIQRSL